MGQKANNRGRAAALDEKKVRAAGRSGRTGQNRRETLRDSSRQMFARGKAAGAFGKQGVANPRGRGGSTRGAGGGGGSQTRAKASAVGAQVKTTRSSRPARKRAV